MTNDAARISAAGSRRHTRERQRCDVDAPRESSPTHAAGDRSERSRQHPRSACRVGGRRAVSDRQHAGRHTVRDPPSVVRVCPVERSRREAFHRDDANRRLSSRNGRAREIREAIDASLGDASRSRFHVQRCPSARSICRSRPRVSGSTERSASSSLDLRGTTFQHKPSDCSWMSPRTRRPSVCSTHTSPNKGEPPRNWMNASRSAHASSP